MPHHGITWGAIFTNQQRAQHQASLIQTGPRILIEIGITDAAAAVLTAAGLPIPQPITGAALIDTGASNTSIDDASALQLQLQVIRTIQVHTPAGVGPQNVYPAKLSFPGTLLPQIAFQAVSGAALANQGLLALLGRDFLNGKILHYDAAFMNVSLSW